MISSEKFAKAVSKDEMLAYRRLIPGGFRSWRKVRWDEEDTGLWYTGFFPFSTRLVERPEGGLCADYPTAEEHQLAQEVFLRVWPFWNAFCVGPWYVESRSGEPWLGFDHEKHARERDRLCARYLNRVCGRSDWSVFTGGFVFGKATAFSFVQTFVDYGLLHHTDIMMYSLTAPIALIIDHHAFIGVITHDQVIHEAADAAIKGMGLRWKQELIYPEKDN